MSNKPCIFKLVISWINCSLETQQSTLESAVKIINLKYHYEYHNKLKP